MKSTNRTQTPVLLASFALGGRPVAIRPELQEELPAHADMLRYDLGFHCPADPSLLIFPLFRHKTGGIYPRELTTARWDSFSLRLSLKSDEESYEILREHNIDEWITYQRPGNAHALVPMSLSDWLKANPAITMHGWKTLPAVHKGRYWAVTG